MLPSTSSHPHIRKMPSYRDFPEEIWGTGMPRFLPTILMNWPCLDYETAVQIGLQFTVPLCRPDIGRIVKAVTPGFSSSSPVLIVPWLEVSVLILSARLLIRRLIWLCQSVAHVASQILQFFFFFSSEATKVQKKIPSEKYLQLWNNFQSVFPLVKTWLLSEKLPRGHGRDHRHLGCDGARTKVVHRSDLSWVRFTFFSLIILWVSTRVFWGLIYSLLQYPLLYSQMLH